MSASGLAGERGLLLGRDTYASRTDGDSACCRAVGADRVRVRRQHRDGARARLPGDRHLPHLLRVRRPLPRATPGRRRCGSTAAPPRPARRSFGLLDARRRHRSGPVHPTDSVADTTVASFSARPRAAARASPTSGTSPPSSRRARSGPAAPTCASRPAWQTSTPPQRRTPGSSSPPRPATVVRDGGTATIADFTDEHGDGPGYLLAGFGCDGEEFSIDRLRYGSPGKVTTYDLEGIAATARRCRSARQAKVAAGDQVTITGPAVDGTGAPIGALDGARRPSRRAPRRFKAVGDAVPASTDGWSARWSARRRRPIYRWYLPAMGYADDDLVDHRHGHGQGATSRADRRRRARRRADRLPSTGAVDSPEQRPGARCRRSRRRAAPSRRAQREPTDEPTSGADRRPSSRPRPPRAPSDAPSDRAGRGHALSLPP